MKGFLRLIVPEHPRNLAALRISVTAILLVSPETYSAESIAALPAALLSPPDGLKWALHVVPIAPAIARVFHWILVCSAVSGLVGFHSRLSLALVTTSGLYVFGLFQLTGSVTHDMHLLWFSALLAAGPCGDALSIDGLLAKRRGAPDPVPSLRVAVPLFLSRTLLGLVYFFPGFWKLRESGLAWITSDNLENQMYWKWYQNGVLPPVRVDRWGALLHAGAFGVVLLELTFPVLVLFPKTRVVAVIGGLLFHAFSQLFLFIPFVSLWGCYTMLIDWSRVRIPGRSRKREDPTTAVAVSPPSRFRHGERFSVALGTLLVAFTARAGAENLVQAWPFACYPTFQWRAGSAMPDIALEAVRADGTIHVVPDGPGTGGSRTQNEWGTAWRVAGVYGDAPSPERLRGYLVHARQKPAVEAALRDAVAVRFYRAWYSVRPDDAGHPPVRAEFIGEVFSP